jgi:Na+-driven multidrug efflux pump
MRHPPLGARVPDPNTDHEQSGEAGSEPGPSAGERIRGLVRFGAGPTAGGDAGPTAVMFEEGKIKSGKLANLTMWQAIFVLSWPVLIESFLNALVGMVDTTLAASLSEAATDAVGAASYFLWFIGLVGMAIGIGVTAMISRAMGRGRVAAANAALGQAVTLAFIAGLAVGVLIYLLAPMIASLLAMQGEAKALAVEYLRILAAGVPAQTLLLASIAACRGAGDALKPLRVMVVVNVVNIAVSWALSGATVAYAKPGEDGGVLEQVTLVPGFEAFGFGLSGIAWGSVIAWYVGVSLIILTLVRGSHGLRIIGRRLRPHPSTMRRLIRVGLPNFFETFGMWFGNFLIIYLVGQMQAGRTAAAAGQVETGLLGSHIVAIRIEAFSFMPGFAMSMAAATLAGQYLGARSPRMAKLAVLRCTVIASAIMALFGVAFIFAGQQIVGVFSQQPTHLELSPKLLFICGITQIPFAIAICIRGAMRGAGDTRVVMILTLVATYLVRLPLAWLASGVEIEAFGMTLHNPDPLRTVFGLDLHPLVAMWLALCAEHVVRCLFFLARFIQGGWKHAKV